MQPSSSSNTSNKNKQVDDEDFNIITRPRPPRRRQSGLSLIPFRPYVKRLTSTRQPFSYTNGHEKWMVIGRDETFFTQPNARCIGSLIEDCEISEVIRWDIPPESTRLPLMCKLWIIVDGAVVERGRPHLVQDAAIQVFTSGRNLRTILSEEHRYIEKALTTTDRRRRQSWQDINEYHSVAYYQYTNTGQNGLHQTIQCDIDRQQLFSKTEILSDVEEEISDQQKIKQFQREYVQQTIHRETIPQQRLQISITTQTESPLIDRSTSIDSQLIQMFNLSFETNEILLSSIVNPYLRVLPANNLSESISFYRNGIQYKHQCISTGDDYPLWWLQLPTNLILSDLVTKQTEEKEKYYKPSPSPRHDQSVQTDVEKSRPSSRLPKSSSSSTTATSNQYIHEIDLTNRSKRFLTYSENSQKFDSQLSDEQIEDVSCRDCRCSNRQLTLSKYSETDYNTFVTRLNQYDQQTISTPDHHRRKVLCPCLSNDTSRIRTKSRTSTSPTLLSNLLERYERTLRLRERAIAIVNDQLLDIDHVLKRYRGTAEYCPPTKSTTAMELRRDIAYLANLSKEDRPALITVPTLIKDKYRTMPEITSEDMLQGYIPSPRIHITNALLNSPRQRQPRYINLTKELPRPIYCDLCLTDHNTSSAWIKYNERRVEELQKRIDLMLQIDDNEDVQLLLSSPIYQTTITTTPTVTQRIDNILNRQSSSRYPLINPADRILSTDRYKCQLPYRLNRSLPNSPRLLSRNTTRSTTPVSKSVRISTKSVPPQSHPPPSSRSATPRPIVSILRRSSTPSTPRTSRLIESPHVWRDRDDGGFYVLEPFSIPRYYRLYNDVGFREVYNASRILDTYLDTNRSTTKDYSSMVKNFALDQPLLTTTTSAA